MRATLTPNSAALRADAIPPEPPPRTRYWKCFDSPKGGIFAKSKFTTTVRTTTFHSFVWNDCERKCSRWVQLMSFDFGFSKRCVSFRLSCVKTSDKSKILKHRMTCTIALTSLLHNKWCVSVCVQSDWRKGGWKRFIKRNCTRSFRSWCNNSILHFI